jgi:chromosome segregation ATPase
MVGAAMTELDRVREALDKARARVDDNGSRALRAYRRRDAAEARLAKAEQERSELARVYAEDIIPKWRERVAKAEQERDEARGKVEGLLVQLSDMKYERNEARGALTKIASKKFSVYEGNEMQSAALASLDQEETRTDA